MYPQFLPGVVADAAAALGAVASAVAAAAESADAAVEAFLERLARQRAADTQALRDEYPGGYHDFSVVPRPTERLRFERLTRANALVILDLFADDPSPFVDARYKSGEPLAEYVDFVLDEMPWSWKSAGTDYLIYLRATGEAVGLLNLYDLSRERFLDYAYKATVGYQLATDARGQGLGREAVRALLTHVRDHFGRNRVLAMTARDNRASIAFLRALGFSDHSEDYDPAGRSRDVFYTLRLGLPRRLLPAAEYGSDHASYVALVGEAQSADEALGDSLLRLEKWTVGLAEGASRYSYEPDKWTVGAVLQHLLDAERVFAYRALTAARAPGTAVPIFDRDAYARHPRYRNRIGVLIDELRTRRATTRHLLTSLREEDRANACVVDGESVSARAWGFVIAGHMLHHVGILEDRYAGAR